MTARRSCFPVAPTQRSSASSRARCVVSTDRVLVTTSNATRTESPANSPRNTASTLVPCAMFLTFLAATSSGVWTVRAGVPPVLVPRIRLTSAAIESSLP